MMSQDSVLTLYEACNILRISEATMRRLLRDKKIPAHKMGGQWRFIFEELIEWLKGK